MNGRNINLRGAFPEIPESCYNGLMNTARSVQEEKSAKHHSYKTVLIAALIVIATMAVAYAAFSSQVADFFGRLYGKDTQEWLEQGAVDSPQDSVTVSGVTFTMNEVVYRRNGLFGLVSISGEQAENAFVYVEKIGVDKGEMIMPVSAVGYASEKQPDGSVLHSFEVSDRTAIGKGETYTLLLTAAVNDEYRDWLVEIHPSPMSEQIEKTTDDTAASVQSTEDVKLIVPDETAASVQSTEDVKLIVPDEYTQTGTMPVYTAIARDFGEKLQPELLNQSGIAKTDKYRIIFSDEAELSWSPETLFYNEYTGTYNGRYKEPDAEPDMIPFPSLNNAASRLAGDVYSGWPHGGDSWKGITLEKTTLSGITLDEAKVQVEALLATLNVEGYTCDWALDMDVARIQSMGTLMNQMILENQYWNSPIIDYLQVTAENEGFYLHYQNGVKTDVHLFEILVYVTSKGIVDMQLRDRYTHGEVYALPEKLLEPEEILARLPVEIAQSRYSDMTMKSVVSIELTYAPARAANKEDGMVMTPAWYVTYFDTDDASYEAFAVFDAVDGTLLNAIFQ